MKKTHLHILFSISLIILMGVGIYRYQYNNSAQRKQPEASGWKTFKKVSLKDIRGYPTTPDEKKDMQVDDKGHEADHHSRGNSRLMASMAIPDINHRPWKGAGPRPLSSEIDNDYNPQWKEELGKNLLRFLRPNTKTIVKRESSALIKHKGRNLLVEHVLVKLKSPEGRHYGYNAYVDSSSGKIIHTWNRTIHEQFAKNALQLRVSPTKLTN